MLYAWHIIKNQINVAPKSNFLKASRKPLGCFTINNIADKKFIANRYCSNTQKHFWMHPYDHKVAEAKWQAIWSKSNNVNKTETISSLQEKPKFYSLAMFPYPSGSLHIGHARVYTISDMLSRYYKMNGYHVLHPMGWDAFGLPAENAAIERNISPKEWTHKNIKHMKSQLQSLGCQFDWDHEVTTCNPDYYKWTQWLFLQLFKKGLAFQKESYVNWDPVDQTVLANEQVDELGQSWRSGAIVEKKLMKQWYFKITNYAEILLHGLDQLPEWPEKVKKMQKEWIGRTSGAVFTFDVEGLSEKIEVFTTRPDTLLGCSFLVMAPEHPKLSKLIPASNRSEVDQFIAEMLKLNEIQRADPSHTKTGKYIGLDAVHPINKRRIPIFIAPYVVSDYATGALMGVPAHDTRDFVFAKHHNLDVLQVIKPEDEKIDDFKLPFSEYGIVINSLKYDGMTSQQAAEAVVNDAEELHFGRKEVKYNLRDWLVSRQRYWGAPIPIIHCQKCGSVPVPESDLPVSLPEVTLKGKGSPLEEALEWINTRCPCCGMPAKREADTMDTFVDSSWYFVRYLDSKNNKMAFDASKAKKWIPVDAYIGGIEHAILHLLYARFITAFLFEQDLLSSNIPFKALLTQGMVHGKTFRMKGSGRPVANDLVDDKGSKALLKSTGEELEISFEKMSKSKHNGIDPMSVVDQYGADTIRLFLLFKAPIEAVVEWDTNAILGQTRWLNRIWTFLQFFKSAQHAKKKSNDNEDLLTEEQCLQLKQLRRVVHSAIKETRSEYQVPPSPNTAVARLMKLSNVMGSLLQANRLITSTDYTTQNEDSLKSISPIGQAILSSPEFEESMKALLILLSPMAPHFAAEAWTIFKTDSLAATASQLDITSESFLDYDPSTLISENVSLVIQVNGRTKGNIEIPVGLSDKEIQQQAENSPVGQRTLREKIIQRAIVVSHRNIINFIVK